MFGVASLLDHVIPLFLVGARTLGLFMTAPMLNSLMLPTQAKILLGVSLAVAAYPVVGPSAAVGSVSMDIIALAPMLLGEVIIGYTIGLLASMPLILVQLAGYLTGYQMGLSLAQVFNPQIDIAADLPGQMLFLMAMGAFLVVGGPEALYIAVLRTFEGAPPGSLGMTQAPLDQLIALVSSGFEMAMRVAAPVTGTILLVEIALGFLMRTIPQVNILSIGFGIKIMVGVIILAMAAVGSAEAIAGYVEETMLRVLDWSAMVEGAHG